jgi:hypothetical protein
VTDLVVEPLSAVRPEPLRWLWPGYLPRGKLVVLDGDPGVGKSLLTIDLAARLSRGCPLPDGAPSHEPHTTLLFGAEDDAADTIRPRAEAAGADLERLVVGTARGGSLQFPRDADTLAALVVRHRPALVVLDPLLAFLPPAVAVGPDPCVRRALTVLADIAAAGDCTLLMIRHLRKKEGPKALHLGLGSMAFIASARAGLLAGRDPADPTRGVLAVTKANLAGAAPSLGYRVRGADGDPGRAVVEWTGPLDLDANRLVARPPDPLRPRDRVVGWLRAELAAGPRPAAEVADAATAAGIPEVALRRAKAELGVGSRRAKPPGGEPVWYWYDPDAAWPADAPFKKPVEFVLPPLPELGEW